MFNVNVAAEGQSGTNVVFTDTNGVYIFPALREGNYKLTPTQAGRGFRPRSVDIALSTNLQRDFIGFDGFTVSGRVTDATAGVGLSGVQVNINTPEIDSTITDNNGNYLLSGLPEGDYTVVPLPLGFDFTPSERHFILGPANALNVNFTARGNLAISGRVLEGSIGATNIQVRLTSTNNPPLSRLSTTDGNGTFVFTNIPPGLVSISPVLVDRFTPTNRIVDPINYTLPVFTATPPSLSASRSGNTVRITLRGLPSRIYTLQTNMNATGPWTTLAPVITDNNGLLEHVHIHTNTAPGRVLLFRARRP
jgi:hypothetical protein